MISFGIFREDNIIFEIAKKIAVLIPEISNMYHISLSIFITELPYNTYP